MESSPALLSSAAKSALSRSRATIMPVKGAGLPRGREKIRRKHA